MPRYASLDDVLASYPARFRSEKAEGVHAVVFMELTGNGGRNLLLHVDDGTLRIEEGVEENPTLHLKADIADWLAVENGEANPMLLLMTGKIKLRGAVPFATKFMSLFGYGG